MQLIKQMARPRSEQGFSLIELLVVVAIIGILAAAGVVAYQGYTESAKLSTAKAQHKDMVNAIAASLTKCEAGGEPAQRRGRGRNATAITLKDRNGNDRRITCNRNAAQWRNSFRDHFQGSGFRNPYTQDLEPSGTRTNFRNTAGSIQLGSIGVASLAVSSCYARPNNRACRTQDETAKRDLISVPTF